MGTTDPKMPRQKRIWITVSMVFAGGFLYCWFFGFATLLVLQTRWLGREEPTLYCVPKKLPDNSVSGTQGKTLSAGNYVFEIPWADAELADRKTPRNWIEFNSHDGTTLIVIMDRPRMFLDTFEAQLKESGAQGLYDPEVLGSDFSLLEYVLETTPRNISLTATRRENVARSMVLPLKSILLPEAVSSSVFRIHASGFNGFQYGDPSRSPRKINVVLYSGDGRVEFTFSNKNGLPLTQPEINRVIQSLHKKLS